jgi:predicted Zn-dependent peptidase
MTDMKRKTCAAAGLACLLLAAAAPGYAAADRTKTRLENGMPLIHEHDPSSKVTVVQFFVSGGQRGEPDGQDGLAYLTTRLTLEVPSQAQTQDLMDQATRLYMGCAEDYSFITLACLSENLEPSLKLVSRIMRKPLFSGVRIDNIKKQMERQRKTSEDDSINLAHQALTETYFENTPYARSVFGSEPSRKAIKKGHITGFYRNFFQAGNMCIVVSSDLAQAEVHRLLDSFYGTFPAGSAVELPDFPVSAPPEFEPIFLEKDSEQSCVSAGFLLSIRDRREYCIAYLLDCLLGKGIESRLWDLRFRQKLAYSVQSRLTFAVRGSLLEAYLETESSQAETAKRELGKILRELHTSGIGSEELEMTKTYAQAQILRQNETKEARSMTLGVFETMGLGYGFLGDIAAEIEAVTLEEMNLYIRTYLDPERCLFAVVGPAQDLPIQK